MRLSVIGCRTNCLKIDVKGALRLGFFKNLGIVYQNNLHFIYYYQNKTGK